MIRIRHLSPAAMALLLVKATEEQRKHPAQACQHSSDSPRDHHILQFTKRQKKGPSR